MDIVLTNIEYFTQNSEPYLLVVGRDKNGERHEITIRDFRPYLCAEAGTVDLHSFGNLIERVDDESETGIDKKSLDKITVGIPGHVPKVRHGLKHYEADVLYPLRFLIDMGIRHSMSVPNTHISYQNVLSRDDANLKSNLRLNFLDIETDSRGTKVGVKISVKEALDPVTLIVSYDSHTNMYHAFMWKPDYTEAAFEIPWKPRIPSQELVDKMYESKDVKIQLYLFPTEFLMLSAFVNFIVKTRPDLITGWNTSRFDLPLLINRMKKLDINYSKLSPLGKCWAFWDKKKNDNVAIIKGVNLIDLLDAYKKITIPGSGREESYKLDFISNKILKIGKIKRTENTGDMWERNAQELLEYCVADVENTVGIDSAMEIIEYYDTIRRMAGVSLQDVIYSSRPIDIDMLRDAKEIGIRLPSKKPYEGKKERGSKFRGAYVFPPTPGIHKGVLMLDLKALYPSCMLTCNIGMDTLDPNGEIRTPQSPMAPEGLRFTKKVNGFSRRKLQQYLDKRDDMKKKRDAFPAGSTPYNMYDILQKALKGMINAFYGVLGMKSFRMYDPSLAEAITTVAQAVIKFTAKITEEMGFTVLAGDTDSIMLALGGRLSNEELVEKGLELATAINKRYDAFAKENFGVDEHFFEIKFEKLYSSFLMGEAKKLYAGMLAWREGKWINKFSVSGFGARRSDNSRLSRKVQKDVLRLAAEGANLKKIHNYLQRTLKSVRKLGPEIFDIIGIPEGVQSMERKGGMGATIRGMIYANEHFGLKLGAGDKPKRVYVKGTPPGYPATNVICFEEYYEVPREFIRFIDWSTMIEKTVDKKIADILALRGWSVEDVKHGKQQMGLSDFG